MTKQQQLNMAVRQRRKAPPRSSEAESDMDDQATGPDTDVEPSQTKKQQPQDALTKALVRIVAGAAMIATFAAILYAGHMYAWFLVVTLQTLLFRELVNVRYRAAAEKNIPWFRSVQWCWFFVAILYNYGESVSTFLETRKIRFVPPMVVHYLRYHLWISFSLYALLFILSVLSFKKGYYRYQMGQLTWTFVTLGLIVFQLKYILVNIFNGLFWFVFPASLVVCNDICAWFCGKLCGRKFIKTPFLRLSPNKTWEGFIGAFGCTILFGLVESYFMAQYPWMICPLESLQLNPQSLSCTPRAVFVPTTYILPQFMGRSFGMHQVELLPIQIHSIVFSIFASVVAPFGGFMASAIKRAYRLKDFDSVIPGHGGVMDRMDCQFIMGMFTSVYFHTFLRASTPSVTVLLTQILQLSEEEQLELFVQLKELLGQ